MDGLYDLNWWQLTLSIFGVLGLLSVLVSIFIRSETLTDDLHSESTHPIDSPDFLKAISRLVNSPISKGGEAYILNNADEFLPKVLTDIRSASQSINLTNYIWKAGEFGNTLLDALIEKQKEGVEVRLLLDTMGSKFMPKDKVEELREKGGLVKYFRTPKIGRLSRFHKRNHRRAIIVDGQVGYLGGVAIDDNWLGSDSNKDRWHDSMTRVTGPMALHIQSAFAQLWTSTTGEILSSEKFYPEIQLNGNTISINVLSSPAEDTQPLPHFLWYSLESARKSIHLTNPYFLPPTSILKALISAEKRGVDVKIILPSNLTDAKLVRWAGHKNYENLLKEGVRIFEYSKSRLHSKHLVVDGKWSVVGSANMDNRSMALNQENILGILDDSFGIQMEKIFSSDLSNSQEIKIEKWEKRNAFKKILEYSSGVFEKQY